MFLRKGLDHELPGLAPYSPVVALLAKVRMKLSATSGDFKPRFFMSSLDSALTLPLLANEYRRDANSSISRQPAVPFL